VLKEWLETDQLGGYSMGTADLVPQRRYHALYVSPAPHSERRHVLLHTPLVEVQIGQQWHALSSFRFADGTIHPEGQKYLNRFLRSPWPTWDFTVSGCQIRIETLLIQGQPGGLLRLSVIKHAGEKPVFRLRPFLSLRDHHSQSHCASQPPLKEEFISGGICWSAVEAPVQVYCRGTAQFIPDPLWYYAFYYQEEAARGYEAQEDLYSPGYFMSTACEDGFILRFSSHPLPDYGDSTSALAYFSDEIDQEQKRRAAISDPLQRAAQQFKVHRNGRASIIAGYPWFSDWGRDTFISLRGLCYGLNDFSFARDVIISWAGTVRDGLIPNRFPDTADEPEYNSIDATLWYLICIGELLEYAENGRILLQDHEQHLLLDTSSAIFSRLRNGTRYHIKVDQDGLLQAGEAGKQLTWMDAKVNDWVVTPRIGKPVEIQALWINALSLFEERIPGLTGLQQQATDSFLKRFWLEDLGYFADVVDCDHQPGTIDISLRPNQIFALGGLPHRFVPEPLAARALKTVAHALLTPHGLRTLSPQDSRYHGDYRGSQRDRDAAYHQGTVWPWLTGAFIDAAESLQNRSPLGKPRRVLRTLTDAAHHQGGHLSELSTGDAPYRFCGAPCQAWSLAELIRCSPELRGPREHTGLRLLRLIKSIFAGDA